MTFKGRRKRRGVQEKPPGSGRFYARVNRLGQDHYFGVFHNATAAGDFYEKIKGEIREERFFPEAYHKRGAGLTLGDWIDEVISRESPGTYKNRQIYFGRFWKKVLGENRPLNQVEAGELIKIRNRLQEKGKRRRRKWSPTTINRYFGFLKKVFNLGVRNQKISANPASEVKPFPEGRRLRFLSEDEEAALEKVMDPLDFLVVRIAINTGLRQEEQFGRTWADVDFGLGHIVLEDPKSKRVEYVLLNEQAISDLKALAAARPGRWIHTSPNGSPVLANNFYKRTYLPALKKAGIFGAVYHTLRHTFVSRLMIAGVDIKTIMELARIRDYKTVLGYAHLAPGHKKGAIELVTRRDQKRENMRPRNSGAS